MSIKGIPFGLKFRLFSFCLHVQAEVKSLSVIGFLIHYGQWSRKGSWLILPSSSGQG